MFYVVDKLFINLLVILVVSRLTDIATDIRTRYQDHVVETAGDGNKTFIVVKQKEMNTQCSAGPIYNPHLVISDDTLDEPQLEFQVFFRSICKEAYTPEVANTYLQSLLPGLGYALCPGIPSFPTEVRFKPKKYREWTSPFVRHNSHTCKLWHVPSHHKRSPNDPLYNSCPMTLPSCGMILVHW